MKILNLFKESYFELKKTNAVVLAGVFIALSIIIGRFSIPIGTITKLSFSFIITATYSMLFGPVYGGILGGIANILKHFITGSGEFFWGWTLNPILAGIIYGVFLYRKGFDANNKKQLLIRIIFAKVIVSVIVNMCLGTYWTYITQGKAFLPLLAFRSVKEIIILPIQIIILFYVLPIVNRLKIN